MIRPKVSCFSSAIQRFERLMSTKSTILGSVPQKSWGRLRPPDDSTVARKQKRSRKKKPSLMRQERKQCDHHWGGKKEGEKKACLAGRESHCQMVQSARWRNAPLLRIFFCFWCVVERRRRFVALAKSLIEGWVGRRAANM